MTYLVDTNVLLRIIHVSDSMHVDAARAAANLIDHGHNVFVIAQNLIEFWAVATRPQSSNGLGLPVADTIAHILTFKQAFVVLPDTADIFLEWERLVDQHKVIGKQVHDARLVAAMKVHHVTHLLTFNPDDFKRYNEITVVNPQNIA
jgi:predicted nucleic acid-binding protein